MFEERKVINGPQGHVNVSTPSKLEREDLKNTNPYMATIQYIKSNFAIVNIDHVDRSKIFSEVIQRTI